MSKMIFNQWLDEKPEFDSECIVICGDGSLANCSAFKILKINCYVDRTHILSYLGWCDMDGDEIDDLQELTAKKYFIVPTLEEAK